MSDSPARSTSAYFALQQHQIGQGNVHHKSNNTPVVQTQYAAQRNLTNTANQTSWIFALTHSQHRGVLAACCGAPDLVCYPGCAVYAADSLMDGPVVCVSRFCE